MDPLRSVAAAGVGFLIAATTVPVAAAADQYLTAARPNGVVGGAAADALAKAIVEALRARGDVAQADGALASAAAWFVAADRDSRKRGAGGAAQRAGFVGAVLTAAAFPVGDAEVWRHALAALAYNLPVTRFGVHLSADGRMAGLVFGDVALALDPFPRHLHAGQTLRLRGELTRRFQRGSVFVTGIDGRVSKTQLAGGHIDSELHFATPGSYRVEVMGYGSEGPVVLANVPVYVDVAEPEDQPGAAPRDQPPQVGAAPPTAQDARARLLALLNDSRRAAGLAALVPDAQLDAIALAHTQDMAAAHFFGHASPTTGQVRDRLARAGVAVIKSGENIAQGDSADEAHHRLMDSPSHRANILDPAFTRVGIAVVLRPVERPALLVTLVFARRPRALVTPPTSAVARDFVASRRRARGAGALAFDPVLQRAAEAGIEVVQHGGEPVVPATALAAAQAALSAELHRLHLPRPAICVQLAQVLELEELDAEPIVASPQSGRVGLAATARRIGKIDTDTIFVLTLIESKTCR